MISIVFGHPDHHPDADTIRAPVLCFADPPVQRDGWTGYPLGGAHEILQVVRRVFSSHRAVTLLPSMQMHATDELHGLAVEVATMMRSDFDDLGNSVSDAFEGVAATIRNLYRKHTTASSETLHDAYKDEPAICIGAGPTATEHLPWIKSMQGKCRIFACDAMAQACRDYGITPDWICAVERVSCISIFADGTEQGLIAPPTVHPDMASKFSRVCWWLGPDECLPWFVGADFTPVPAAASSGTLTVAAALHAGCNEIVLVGHDLAYHAGKSHSTAAHPFASDAQSNGMDGRCLQGSLVEQGAHMTTHIWQIFARNIEDMIRWKPAAHVLRLSPKLPIAGTINIGWAPEWDTPVPYVPLRQHTLTAPWVLPVSIQQAKEHLRTVQARAGEVFAGVFSGEITPEAGASALRLSTLTGSTPHGALFRYLFQSLYSAMHLRLASGADYRATIQRLAATLRDHCGAIVEAMGKVVHDL